MGDKTKRERAECWIQKEKDYGGDEITGIIKLMEVIDTYGDICRDLRAIAEKFDK